MGRAFTSLPVTLTASFAEVGEVARGSSGNRTISQVRVTVRIKHVKDGSQSGGYPVARVTFRTRDVAGAAVYSLDPLLDPNVTFAGGVGTVEANTPIIKILALTDSDGALEFDLVIDVPPGKEAVRLEAKQEGDTTNFGTLYAELEGPF